MWKQPLLMVEGQRHSQITPTLFIKTHPKEMIIFLYTVALVLEVAILELSLILAEMSGLTTMITIT